jgi:hypothetical protein
MRRGGRRPDRIAEIEAVAAVIDLAGNREAMGRRGCDATGERAVVRQAAMGKVAPWANHEVPPMQAAGALIPWHEVDGAIQYKHDEHGTAFFISADGFFLTAGHVVDGYPEFMPAL